VKQVGATDGSAVARRDAARRERLQEGCVPWVDVTRGIFSAEELEQRERGAVMSEKAMKLTAKSGEPVYVMASKVLVFYPCPAGTAIYGVGPSGVLVTESPEQVASMIEHHTS
jgi:hypothetical protein